MYGIIVSLPLSKKACFVAETKRAVLCLSFVSFILSGYAPDSSQNIMNIMLETESK